MTAETLKPSLRALKYEWLRRSAEWKAITSSSRNQSSTKPVVFIVGCGRSGTTVLGQVFSHHPQVSYLFEPYHLWAAVDRRSDVLNLFHEVNACMLMDASHYQQQSQFRFNRLIRANRGGTPAQLVLEKTPLNTLRIGYLEAIAPNSKFIHLVRDGVDVCRSIDKLASTNTYRIAGKPALNQWWGVNDAKWKALARDGTAAGYYANEIGNLETHLSRAAYEWLVTLSEVDRWRDSLGDRIKEISYEGLSANPECTLKNLCEFLEIDSPSSWLGGAVSAIRSPPQKQDSTLNLPPAMCEAFNRYQQKYGFPNRAVSLEEG